MNESKTQVRESDAAPDVRLAEIRRVVEQVFPNAWLSIRGAEVRWLLDRVAVVEQERDKWQALALGCSEALTALRASLQGIAEMKACRTSGIMMDLHVYACPYCRARQALTDQDGPRHA